MPTRSARPDLHPFVVVLLTAVAATAFRLALTPLFGEQYPFITYFPGVTVVARYAGFRPALATLLIGALAAAGLFYHPSLLFRSPTVSDMVGLALFLGLGWFIAWLSEQERQARQRAVDTLEELQHQQRVAGEQAALLQLAQDAILALQPDGTIEFWNRGAEEMYGYPASEAVGQNAHELLKTVFPIERKTIEEHLYKTGGWQGELIHTRADGKQLHVSSRWAIRHGTGSTSGFLEINRDISERQKQDEQLRQSAKLESLGVLAGGIAHDFNNLLTGIMGNASLALDGMSTLHPNRQALEEVLGAAQSAADLTRQLLAYAGKGRFVIQQVNLNDLVREVSTLIQSAIPKHVQIRFDLAAELPAVEGDVGQLQQVVMNLVINGAEAVGAETGTVLITTSTQVVDEPYLATLALADRLAVGTYVVLEVHDTGIGMDGATLARIFDPFFTTKFQGRGLGLAAVQGIVRGHRGGLKVYSTPGKGTTFKVLLPPAAEVAPLPHSRQLETELGGSGLVLVIDDEAFVRKTARLTLERYGYTVLVASDGREGIALFERHRAELRLVLLDLTMPVMGGREALRQMKLLNPAVPVVLSSGFNETEAIRQFTGKGLAGFIQKPYTSAALASKVKEVLRTTA